MKDKTDWGLVVVICMVVCFLFLVTHTLTVEWEQKTKITALEEKVFIAGAGFNLYLNMSNFPYGDENGVIHCWRTCEDEIFGCYLNMDNARDIWLKKQ